MSSGTAIYEEENNQYLKVIIPIRDVSFNTFESAMEGMGWKYFPVDVIDAVCFIVVPREMKTQVQLNLLKVSAGFKTSHAQIMEAIVILENHTFPKRLKVVVYKLHLSEE